MPTASCVCYKCGNIIPIEEEMLGQPVRCPYCQQVVPTPLFIAPASEPRPVSLGVDGSYSKQVRPDFSCCCDSSSSGDSD